MCFFLGGRVDNVLSKHHLPPKLKKKKVFLYTKISHAKKLIFKMSGYDLQITFPRVLNKTTVKVNTAYWDSVVENNLQIF